MLDDATAFARPRRCTDEDDDDEADDVDDGGIMVLPDATAAAESIDSPGLEFKWIFRADLASEDRKEKENLAINLHLKPRM